MESMIALSPRSANTSLYVTGRAFFCVSAFAPAPASASASARFSAFASICTSAGASTPRASASATSCARAGTACACARACASASACAHASVRTCRVGGALSDGGWISLGVDVDVDGMEQVVEAITYCAYRRMAYSDSGDQPLLIAVLARPSVDRARVDPLQLSQHLKL